MTWIYLSILLLLLTYFLRNNNPYKLIMIFGKKGSGKTTWIAKYSQKYIKKGYTVYSNVEIPGTFLYDPKDIGLYTFEPNSIVFCDEVGLIWHNRDFKNFKKCVIEFFKYQRQYKIRMYLFSQTFDTDKVLRDLTDEMYLIRRLGKLSIARPISKQIGIAKDKDGNGQLVDTYTYGSIFNTKFTYIPRYVGLFKSFDPPELPYIISAYNDYNELAEVYSDTKLWVLYTVRKAKDSFIPLLHKFKKKLRLSFYGFFRRKK